MAWASGAGGRPLSGDAEVWVVDNNSTDGSVEYLRQRFPFVNFIANAENIGFAKANNQALAQCRGKFILFLNPDTILPEDCFHQCIAFMEQHERAGAVGVQMIDGSGKYLPESKRGLPTPWVSFCKMSGLSRLFPGSRLFDRYYLGHLPGTEVHEVDVLSGAFMWVRKDLLDRTGGFDERFFMYAEDIDLSYRIQLAGYQNYYLPSPVIIHFKGESTRRDARYIRLFYTAMIQFVEKYYRGFGAWCCTRLLQAVIFFKSIGTGDNKSSEIRTGAGIHGINLSGDRDSIGEMTGILRSENLEITQLPENLSIRILCEGKQASFKDLIQSFGTSAGNQQLLIHGLTTQSAAGSSRKDQRGVTMGLSVEKKSGIVLVPDQHFHPKS